MIKMVAMLQPFERVQKIYVYENGNLLDVSSTSMEEFPSAVFALKDKYNVTKLDLVGATRFSKGFKEKIHKEELVRYNNSTLEITVQ